MIISNIGKGYNKKRSLYPTQFLKVFKHKKTASHPEAVLNTRIVFYKAVQPFNLIVLYPPFPLF